MKSKQILIKFLGYYKKRGHKLIPNVSLVPENDSTLLYVNSGMFPLVPYLSGETHPLGKRLMNVQRALRFFEDIDNIGITNRHTTAFHMLGNWSIGEYFKKEQLNWVYEFYIEIIGLDPSRMYASVFAGDEYSPKDTESIDLLKKIFSKYGIEAKENERIFPYGREDNWWQRGDAPGELGGPDSEVFYYLGEGTGIGLNPAEHQDEFLEIGNSVFMQYRRTNDGGWNELPQKNVDFGGGLERIALISQRKKDIFQTDNFWPIIQKLEKLTGVSYNKDGKTKKAMSIIADHMRASTLLVMDGVIPSNKDQGYLLRRLIRRMVRAGKTLQLNENISVNLVSSVIEIEVLNYLYPELKNNISQIQQVFSDEEDKFRTTFEKGSNVVHKYLTNLQTVNENQVAESAFSFYESLGYPLEIFLEDIKDTNLNLDVIKVESIYNVLFKQHRDLSRKGAEQKFKGGLADHSDQVIKYHTATHLLDMALRNILGNHVTQQGSNISKDRLRFDFSHQNKLTSDEITKIESLVNETIKTDLPVNFILLPMDEAEKSGALHFFKEKYGDIVKFIISEKV
ncbi:MAG: alanine--tRNA ligase [bacterium]|nr:alanine--tRNA ligase [bacterium]